MANVNVAARSTYLNLVKATHPDLHPNDPSAEEKFKQIQENKEKINYSTIVNISLEEAISGCQRYYIDPESKLHLVLDIPKGIKHNQTILFKNNITGTISVKILIDLPNHYCFSGNNLVLTIYLSYISLYFGKTYYFNGPDGKRIKIIIPKKVKSGTVYKLPYNGLFNSTNNQRDPLYIRFIGRII